MPTRYGDWLYYGYVPTESVNIAILVLFSVSAFAHFAQALHSKLWWLLPTAGFCGVLEVLGWAARLWSGSAPYNRKPYLIQTIVTILAPTPLLAANFVILRLIIDSLGRSYSRISPKWYAIIFCTSDVLSLLVQGAGGALAAAANTMSESKMGGHIALAGIVFQTSIIIVFILCAAEFYVRYFKDLPVKPSKKAASKELLPVREVMDRRMVLMSVALVFSTLCLFVRALYRTVELADGWNGKIVQTEILFIVLDGVMVVLAMLTLNVLHPSTLLRSTTLIRSETSSEQS